MTTGSDGIVELEFWALCPRGLEDVLAEELKGVGARRVRPLTGGVSFMGGPGIGYAACLWSRTASRVLQVLGRVDASDADSLYATTRELAWDAQIGRGATIAVRAHGVNDHLRNTQFTAVRIKDAVCDMLRDTVGYRPDVDTVDPDVLINVSVKGDRATVSVDYSGDSLHLRPYREGESSLRSLSASGLAAGALLRAGWDHISCEGGLVDAMCGTATYAIEAALIAGDWAPNLNRARFAFMGLAGYDEETFSDLIADADDRAEAGEAAIPQILAFDDSSSACKIASRLIASAGLSNHIELARADLFTMETAGFEPRLVTVEPPYGEKTVIANLPAYSAALASRVFGLFPAAKVLLVTPEEPYALAFGQRGATWETRDGKVTHRVYEIEPRSGNGTAQAPMHSITVRDAKVEVFHEAAGQFAARLAKVFSQRGKWARRNAVTNFRVYDADLPDYNISVDLFEGAGPDVGRTWVHVSEYAAPSEIDPVKAAHRLTDALAIIPVVMDVDPSRIFVKTRRRDRGGSQYAGNPRGQKVTGIVNEDYLLFELDFTSHLDVGLFLDHRLTREMIFEWSEGARFLNLFAYSGTATVHAAAGGAYQTTTVDMSGTYLDWAARNMRLNGFGGGRHEYVRADVVRWVSEMRRTANRWDLVFCDPPTFSNSSKMGQRSFDVQRDHAELLISISRLLTRGGRCIFSCNLSSFRPDVEKLERAGVGIEDITAETIPVDFERRPKVHHAFIVKRVR